MGLYCGKRAFNLKCFQGNILLNHLQKKVTWYKLETGIIYWENMYLLFKNNNHDFVYSNVIV